MPGVTITRTVAAADNDTLPVIFRILESLPLAGARRVPAKGSGRIKGVTVEVGLEDQAGGVIGRSSARPASVQKSPAIDCAIRPRSNRTNARQYPRSHYDRWLFPSRHNREL